MAIIACTCVALAVACGNGSKTESSDATNGPDRSFMLGFSTVPRALNAAAYADTFKLAADNGEIVLIQRTPKWSEFLPGAAVSDDTAQTTASEKKSISDRGLRLFFAIDPTDGATGRDRLADLPSQLFGHNFGDPDVRTAFVSYAKYVALNYRPAYLALGVEMNEYYEKNAADFENYKTLYAETYDAVKQISPDTQITVTFQYEDLLGILPTTDQHYPDYQLLKAFDPRLDVMTISTYPSLSFASPEAIPSNYYTQLRAFAKQPIAIAAMGYSSAASPTEKGGGESDQAAFLRRAFADAEKIGMPFVVWFAGWDPSFARDSAYSAFQHIGLLTEDGSQKPAWDDWLETARRPYRRN
jgi:hypothetical protein